MAYSKAQYARWEAQETEDTKTCLRCGKIKPLHSFYAHEEGRKFTHPQCKKCLSKSRKDNYTLREYGITLNDYDEMLRNQGGGCKICGTKTPKGSGRFHIDHDHKTGKVRGILCNNCNMALGLMKDNPKILISAAQYLNENKR